MLTNAGNSLTDVLTNAGKGLQRDYKGITKGLPMRESDYSEELGVSIYSCRILGEILSFDLLGFPSGESLP